MRKGVVHQEDITLVNVCVPNRGAPKYVKQLLTELKGKTDQNTLVVGGLNIPLSGMDRSSRKT